CDREEEQIHSCLGEHLAVLPPASEREVARLDDTAPLLLVLGKLVSEHLWCATNLVLAEPVEELVGLGICKNLVDRSVDLGNELIRHAGRRKNTGPEACSEFRMSEFLEGRNVGQLRRALVAGDSEHSHFTGADLTENAERRRNGKVNLTCEDV